ncbi:LysR family transcriptional regulator [Devosia rhodophyticola]|uniref:LysR family transcriptional regulator n=1 Tax=Devosia rhodophyticola TaxID=3026423 RepID=A0ABY7YUY8_9HYPH|nr:LysR family transcriptional regulator [Devosia rhodophyticola]WDR05181.1 LysR family transcriptional regulator [Devosia rhodophyticola]
MLDRMNLLFRFQAIAEAGSVRRAAERLNITQPALSRSLGQLEKHYGQPLLERHARGVRPTGFGQRLLSTISRLARDWELAEIELASGGRLADGLLRINAGPLWSAVVLPRVLTQLHEIFPNLVVEIGNRSGAVVNSDLMEGRIDVSFGGMHAGDMLSSQLEVREFTHVHDRVMARSGHPIHQCGPVDYTALHDYPWIIYAIDPVYEAETLHALVERTGTPPQVRVRSGSLLAALRLLQEGNYLCMLPNAAVTGMQGEAIIPTPLDMGRRSGPSGAIFRRAIANYAPMQELLRLCAAHFDLASHQHQHAFHPAK